MRNRTENQIDDFCKTESEPTHKLKIELVLIRHGATASNAEHRYLGKEDEELSAAGREFLLQEKEKGSYPEVDFLFSSPMKRCLETAKLLYPDKEPISIPEWKEMDFGLFEGKNYQDLQNNTLYQAWIDSNGTLPFPEGESREVFIQRCNRGFDRMFSVLKDLLETGEGKNIDFPRVGLVVHGGTIMALLSSHCGGDYFDYQVANGKGYVCRALTENLGERKEMHLCSII